MNSRFSGLCECSAAVAGCTLKVISHVHQNIHLLLRPSLPHQVRRLSIVGDSPIINRLPALPTNGARETAPPLEPPSLLRRLRGESGYW